MADAKAPTFKVPDYEPESDEPERIISAPGAAGIAQSNNDPTPDTHREAIGAAQPDEDEGPPVIDPAPSVPSTGESSDPDKIDENKTEGDNIHEVPTNSEKPAEMGHLKFAESAKDAATKVSRKLHLHRETGRGPSEARQRRQSSVVVIDDDAPIVPWYLHLRNALYGSLNLLISFPYWDMAFWSGSSYTLGSILFVIDGAWAWTPLQWPSSEFPGEAEYGVGLLFFFGALCYQVGATMAYLESINDGSFAGPAMKRHLQGHDEEQKKLLDDKLHMFFGHMIPHHHRDDDESGGDLEKQQSLPGQADTENKAPAPRRGGVDVGPGDEDGFHEYLTWRWYPTWDCLRTYHIRDLGYLACSIQLLGATLYAICGVIALPGILSGFTTGQAIGGYWIPQTVASVCFLTAGIMFTLITQEKWNRPLPRRIAWWIGVWATIGSVGFL